MVWKQLQISNREFNLENTLVNGQCFNWRKLGHDHFEGVFSKYYVQLRRANDNTVDYFTVPDDEEETKKIPLKTT